MKLVQARKAKGLTQANLVQMSGVSIRSIGEIENGWKQPPSITYMMARNLCEALQMDVAEIEEFQGVERPGDPCPCSCPGVKVPPIDPLEPNLLISCPCPLCGADRTRLQRKWKSHAIPCIKCSNGTNGARKRERRIVMTCPDCKQTRNVPVCRIKTHPTAFCGLPHTTPHRIVNVAQRSYPAPFKKTPGNLRGLPAQQRMIEKVFPSVQHVRIYRSRSEFVLITSYSPPPKLEPNSLKMVSSEG